MILPVVGLLLLLGLFWYWASTLIGDDNDSPESPTAAVVITQMPSVETPTQETNIVPDESTQTADNAQPTNTPQDAASGDETPTEEATTDAGNGDQPVSDAFAVDDVVVTNDSANLRTDPTADSDAVTVLAAGTELIVIGGPEADESVEDRIWWQVRDEATGDEGWVVEDAIDAST